MEKLKNKLREHHGSVMVEAALACLIGLMFLTVGMETSRIHITVNMIKSKVDAAVLTVAAANVSNVYDGVRESAGSARSVSNGDWAELVSTEEVQSSLTEVLSLTPAGNALEHISSANKTVYRLSNLDTAYMNADGNNLNFKTTLTVTIPLNFLGLSINQNLEVSTTYDAKF